MCFRTSWRGAWRIADEVVVANVFKSDSIPEAERLDLATLAARLQKQGRRARIVPEVDGIVQLVAPEMRPETSWRSVQRRLRRDLRKIAATAEIDGWRRLGQPSAEGLSQSVKRAPRTGIRSGFVWLAVLVAMPAAAQSPRSPLQSPPFDTSFLWPIGRSTWWKRITGRTLAGRVRSTWLGGTDISADVEKNGDRRGRLLRRGEA